MRRAQAVIVRTGAWRLLRSGQKSGRVLLGSGGVSDFAGRRRWSTIRVSHRTYSVPSRLIGYEVEVRQHPDTVEVFYRGQLVETMPRLRGEYAARIDYRHVIWSLVRKPGAFAGYKYREELFPSMTFRRAYDALRATRGDRADIEYLRKRWHQIRDASGKVPAETQLYQELSLGQRVLRDVVNDETATIQIDSRENFVALQAFAAHSPIGTSNTRNGGRSPYRRVSNGIETL